MPRPKARTEHCDRRAALHRLAQAESFVEVVELVLADDTDATIPALAVLAGSAGSDAPCCARLGLGAPGQAHDKAVKLLATVAPHGSEMAKDLDWLLSRKDPSHYGVVCGQT